MKIIDRTVSDVINTEYREYAMYVLESRAIPSVIDGLKMVHRKLLYSMLNEYSGKKVKLADLSGISNLGYHHGENSAAQAAVTLTADWNNNCPLFYGHEGNYGSRMVMEAAAPRYIFASISPEFKKIFIDAEVAPQSDDDEHPEPIFYLPIIPWVLVNGIDGISVGFKTSILPRSIKDITDAVKAYLKAPERFLKDNALLPPTFPSFNGKTLPKGSSQWITQGIIKFIGKNTYEISELPVGYDRETYVTLLNDLCDKDLIKDYEDGCSKSGFNFKIKVTGAQKEAIDKDPIKYFKLEKTHTEILTTMGIDGKLKIFQSVSELIGYFCDYRLKKFGDKIEYDRAKLVKEISVLTDKQKFIQLVIDGKVDFRKTTKIELLKFIEDYVTKSEHGKSFIRIPLYEITKDTYAELEQTIAKLNTDLKILEVMTSEKLFNTRINALKV